MIKLILGLLCFLVLVAQGFATQPADFQAGNQARQALIRAILASDSERSALIAGLSISITPEVRPFIIAWQHDNLFLYQFSPTSTPIPVAFQDEQDAQGKVLAIRIDDGSILADSAGKQLRFGPSDLPEVPADMRLRGQLRQLLDVVELRDGDPEKRLNAAAKLGMSRKTAYLLPLRDAMAKEANSHVSRAMQQGIALIELGSSDPEVASAAALMLGKLDDIGALDLLTQTAADTSVDSSVRQAAGKAAQEIKAHISFVDFCGTIFRGLSLGSVLLIVALGLAITFGLMGVINMAHGEMIAVGAYTCYVVQNLFANGFGFSINLPFSVGGTPLGFGLHLPGLHASGWVYQCYFLFAIPLSFVSAACVGFLLEKLVIRFLYSRPLESLLATWGVSLVLQQIFRMIFGANNVQVDSPTWMLGNLTFHDVVFDYNRIFVIIFAVLIVFGTWFLLTKTPLGLLIRAVMQNRNMASCIGVRTERVNSLTFAFGSGLAGLAGAFLSQIGNVGPSMGQNYIVDSFMTVVVGGVGNIIGTIVAALGMGTADQVLQQVLGSPVMGKILVLVTIILFLQWKPGGFFPSRSRSLDE